MENTELQLFRQTVVSEENDCIFIQPICDLFEIDLQNQYKFIQNDPILESQKGKNTSNLLFGDNRQRLYLTKKGFVRWIQLLNPNIVRDDLREKLIQYQTNIFDFIYGEAIVPNIKREYEIESRQRELNGQINKLMLEHRSLELEKRGLRLSNYVQLGLEFNEHQSTGSHNLEPFHTKELS